MRLPERVYLKLDPWPCARTRVHARARVRVLRENLSMPRRRRRRRRKKSRRFCSQLFSLDSTFFYTFKLKALPNNRLNLMLHMPFSISQTSIDSRTTND